MLGRSEAGSRVEIRDPDGRRRSPTVGADLGPADRATLLGWLALSTIGALAPGADVAATSAAWSDELRLAPVLAAGWRSAGLDESEAWAADGPHPGPAVAAAPVVGRGRSLAARDTDLLRRWLANQPTRAALGVNTWQGEEWLDRDRFVALLTWAVRLDAIDAGEEPDAALVARLTKRAEAAGYRLDRLLEPRASPAKPPARPTPRPAK